MKKEIQSNVPNIAFKHAEILTCPHLRYIRDWYDKNKKYFVHYWVAKGKDPCPTCKQYQCHNYNKSFDQPESLIIEKQ